MKTRYAIFTMLTVLLLAGLFSCSNFFSVKDGVYTDAKTKITLSGTLTADGALPHEVFKPETKTAGRSAVPLFDESNLTFEITAKKTRDSSVVAGTISDDHSSFTIPDLELTEEYVITVQAKKGNTVVLEDSEPITLTRENSNSLHMTLLPKADGKGSVNLDISTGDCEVSKIVWSFDDGEPVTVKDASSTTISIPEVEAGSHLLCLKFYSRITDGSKSQEVWIASCYENVNVLSGLVTDTWIRSAGMTDLHLIPAGRPDGMDIQEFLISVMDENTRSFPAGPATFELYSFFLNRLSDSPLFVSESGNDTTGTGSPFNPYRTLTKAINQALTIPAEHSVTIMVEPGLSEILTKDLVITDTYIDIEVYNLSENQSYQTEYTIDTNGHNITISGESRLTLDQAAITNTSGTSSTIFLETEDPHDDEHWGSSVYFRGCTLDNLLIDNYGTIFLGSEYYDFADNVLTDTKIFMKGNSRIYIEDEHEQNSLYVDISEHDADTWTYLPVQTAGQYCNFIYNEYQTDVVESFFHEYPHDAIYVNPAIADSKETGTVRNPYKTLASAVENVEPGAEIVLLRGTTYCTGNMSTVTISKDLTIGAYGEGDSLPVLDSTRLQIDSNASVQINNIAFKMTAVSGTTSGVFVYVESADAEVECNSCTFTGAKATIETNADGGAIFNNGKLTATDCSFVSNQAENGGAIYNDCEAVCTLTRCTLKGNTARSLGGALFNLNTCTLTDCTFENNSAGFDGGAIYADGPLSFQGNTTIGGNTVESTPYFLYLSGELKLSGTMILSGQDRFVFQNSSVVSIADDFKIDSDKKIPLYNYSPAGLCFFDESSQYDASTYFEVLSSDGVQYVIGWDGVIRADLDTYYVDSNSTSPFKDGIKDTPYKKISDAVTAADNSTQTAVTIYVKDGTVETDCSESLQFTKDVTIKVYKSSPETADSDPGQATLCLSNNSNNNGQLFISGSLSATGIVFECSESTVASTCNTNAKASFTNCTFKNFSQGFITVSNEAVFTNCAFTADDNITSAKAINIDNAATVTFAGTLSISDKQSIYMTYKSSKIGKINLDSSLEQPDVPWKLAFSQTVPDGTEVITGDEEKVKDADSYFDAGEKCITSKGCIQIRTTASGSVSTPAVFDDLTVTIARCGGTQVAVQFKEMNSEMAFAELSSISCEITYYGDVVPDTKYYVSDEWHISLSSALPDGPYTITMYFTYNGKMYNASFDVTKDGDSVSL